MGVTAKFQGSRAQKSRHGEERNDQEQPNNVEPTALRLLRKQCQTCQEKTVPDLSVTEAASQQSPTMNKQDKTP